VPNNTVSVRLFYHTKIPVLPVFLPHQKTRKNIDPSTTLVTLKGAKHTPFLSDCFTTKKTRKDIASSKTLLKLDPRSLVLTGLKLEVKS
jgi:hypothetical protein